MGTENIPKRRPTGHDDRMTILVAVEPHTYRMVIEPEELQAEVAHLDPALVVSSQPKPATYGNRRAWVEFHPYEQASAKVCIGNRCAWLHEPGLDDLLLVVDEAERLLQTPLEGSAGLCLTASGNGGKSSSCGPGVVMRLDESRISEWAATIS
jgi:hypothetical protein